MNPTPRYAASVLTQFAVALLSKAGMPHDRAAEVAGVLVEGDLLGHDTHGLQLLGQYLGEIETGAMTLIGEPEVINDRGAVVTWDGKRLPGPSLGRPSRLGCWPRGVFGAGAATWLRRRRAYLLIQSKRPFKNRPLLPRVPAQRRRSPSAHPLDVERHRARRWWRWSRWRVRGRGSPSGQYVSEFADLSARPTEPETILTRGPNRISGSLRPSGGQPFKRHDNRLRESSASPWGRQTVRQFWLDALP